MRNPLDCYIRTEILKLYRREHQDTLDYIILAKKDGKYYFLWCDSFTIVKT